MPDMLRLHFRSPVCGHFRVRLFENPRGFVFVKAHHIGFIIGTHGATIKQLREIHEVKLDKIDTGFTIVGSRREGSL